MIIGRASADDSTTFDRWSYVSIVHVTAIHDLPTPAPAASGG
jgi:hypothetical protein